MGLRLDLKGILTIGSDFQTNLRPQVHKKLLPPLQTALTFTPTLSFRSNLEAVTRRISSARGANFGPGGHFLLLQKKRRSGPQAVVAAAHRKGHRKSSLSFRGGLRCGNARNGNTICIELYTSIPGARAGMGPLRVFRAIENPHPGISEPDAAYYHGLRTGFSLFLQK